MGPLQGVKIVEVAGIGPGPYAAMLLADLGADVIRVDRTSNVFGGDPEVPPADIMTRSRRSIALDLKQPEAIHVLLDLIADADGLIEGFRPGVAERLGFGPEVCAERNPRLVYGRMTGWGQTGPYAEAAGHDINYISLSGTLWHLGRKGEGPTPPMNLAGDFGGGGMMLAFGMVCGILNARGTGRGQVIDAAMVDGGASLMSMFWAFDAMGIFNHERGTNMLDTGAHFYDVYECADGEYVSIGSIEPQFYAELLRLTGLEGEELPHQMDKSNWDALKERLGDIFRSKTRDEWCEIMEHTDVCFAPVLSMKEALLHPHNVERGTFVEVAGVPQPAPVPRFSETPGAVSRPPAHAGQHTDEVLTEWLSLDTDRLASLRSSGAIA